MRGGAYRRKSILTRRKSCWNEKRETMKRNFGKRTAALCLVVIFAALPVHAEESATPVVNHAGLGNQAIMLAGILTSQLPGPVGNILTTDGLSIVSDSMEDTEAAPDIKYVTDAYFETIEYQDEVGNETPVSYRIPQINLDFPNVKELNQSIYHDLYEGENGTGGIQDELNNMEAGYSIVLYETDYEWAVNGDTLSLVTCSKLAWNSICLYGVYNLSVSTGQEISTADLLETIGWEKSEYEEKAKQAACSRFWDTYYDFYEGNKDNTEMLLQLEDQLQETISAGNIEAARPYLNSDNQLCVICNIYSMAGAGIYETMLDLENFTLSPHYSEKVEY